MIFGIWGCDRIRTDVAALVLPYHGWLEEPLHKGVGWDGVALGANASKDVRCLITLPGDVMKFEPLELSRYL